LLLLRPCNDSTIDISFRREREVTVEKVQIRAKRERVEGEISSFKIGDWVEVLALPNNPHVHSDVVGWRRARVVNFRGKYASLEFDSLRHPY